MPRVEELLMRVWQSTRTVLGIEGENGVRRALAEAAAVVAISLASTTALAQPFYVPSGSMQPTLEIGDAFIASKFPYGYSRYSVPFAMGPASANRLLQHLPQVGDVVVFRSPRDPSVTLVKRVVGLPGDRLQMIGGRLWINGKALALAADGTGTVESEEGHEMQAARYIETLPNGVKHPIFKLVASGALDDTEAFVVPAGHTFMMGDNRDNSADSRLATADGGVGYVPVENLVGRAEFVVGSHDYLNAHSVWSWATNFRLSRFFNSVN